MKREIINKYSLKIEFSPNTENPSRIFQAMADLINSFKAFDEILANSINSTVQTKQVLENIEKGSIVSNLMNKITIDDQELIGGPVDSDGIGTYFEDGRKKALDSLAGSNTNGSSVDLVKDCQKAINEIAERTGLKSLATYKTPDSVVLAQGLSSLANSVKSLGDDEKASYSDKASNQEVGKSAEIDLKQIEESLTDKTIENKVKLILLIKKPDFLGESRWEFRHDKQTITANITDDSWLDSFKAGQIPICPGDAIEVELLSNNKYDKHGQLISSSHQVVKVLNVIHHSKPENGSLI